MTEGKDQSKRWPGWNKPSPGFIYLLIVFLFSVFFFSWILGEAWYERINTPMQTGDDLKKWDQYKASIEEYKTELEESLSQANLDSQIKEWQEKLNADPADLNAQTWIIYYQYKYNQKEAAFSKALQLLDRLDILPLPVLEVLCEEVLSKGLAELNERIIDLILLRKYPTKKISEQGQVITLGINYNWTTKENLNLIIVKNNQNYPVKPILEMECPTISVWPISVSIKLMKGGLRGIIKNEKPIKLALPVIPAGEKRMCLLKTDKNFRIERRRNRYGIKIRGIMLKKGNHD